MKAVARVTIAAALIAGVTYPILSPADHPAAVKQAPEAKSETYVINGTTIVVPPYVAPPSQAEREKFGPRQEIDMKNVDYADFAQIQKQYPKIDAIKNFKDYNQDYPIDETDASNHIYLGTFHDKVTNTDVLIITYNSLGICTNRGCPTDIYVKDAKQSDSEYTQAFSRTLTLPVAIRSQKGTPLVLDPAQGSDDASVPFYYYHPELKKFLMPEDEALLQKKTNPSYAPPPGDPETPDPNAGTDTTGAAPSLVTPDTTKAAPVTAPTAVTPPVKPVAPKP